MIGRRRPRRRRVRPGDTEFLPAALEITESPPSPVGRAVAFSIALVLVAAVAWATVGRLDVVAVARGKIIASGRSKVIQPLESGIVRAIRVRDGQTVAAGTVLIELDPTTKAADHDRLVHEQRAALVQAARVRALMAGETTLVAPPGAASDLVALQARMLADQQAEHASRLEAARLLIEQRAAAAEVTRADIVRLEATVPILTERAEAFRKLLAGEYVARMQYLEVEEQRIARVQELAAQRQRLVQDLATLAEARQQREVVAAEFRRARGAELAEWETRAASLAHEVVKAEQGSRIQRLVAPVAGVVQQLAVHTIGGVVTPAQPLLVLVPRGDRLEVEAWVENKDVGFVEPGQAVEVKVDTFPFTRYGTISGRVLTVSPDAVPLDNVGPVFAARMSLERAVVQVDDRAVPLSPGMSVSVEIKTGQRRLIEFFFSPLLRATREAARER